MTATKLVNEVVIQTTPETVFNYVSRPDLWHEWHPASRSAVLPRTPLQIGDHFDEVIAVNYPFISVKRATRYRVTKSEPGKVWEVQGSSTLFDLTIHYDFYPQDGGTLFRRTLTYSVKGLLALFEPLLVRPKIARQSAAALAGLKRKLEQS